MRIDSKGHRRFFALLLVITYAGTLAAFMVAPTLDQGRVLTAFEILAGILGVAITGETVRPSGSGVAAIFGTRAAPTVVAPTGDAPVVNVEPAAPPPAVP